MLISIYDFIRVKRKFTPSNQRGSVLIPVVVITSVAILIVTIAISMIPSYQKEAMFIQQKLSVNILKYGIEEILKEPTHCICLFHGKTINPTVSPGTPQTIDLDKIKKGGCGTGPVSEILISETGQDENIGYGLKVDDIRVDNILLSSSSSTQISYSGELRISYETESMLRSVGEFKIPLIMELDINTGTNIAKSISSCFLIIAKSSKEKGNCGFSGLQKGHPHINGRGWVSDTATVDASAYVGPDAKVCEEAKVLGQARIEDKAVVMDTSVVSGSARVSGEATIIKSSNVSGSAQVSDKVEVYNSIISGQASISDEAKIHYSEITDEAVINDHARVSKARVAGKSKVTGYTIVDLGAEINGGPGLRVEVRDYSRVTRGSVVSGGAHVYGTAFVSDGAQVSGSAKVFGNAQVGHGSVIDRGNHQ